jgi:ribosome-associated heat shock protein Hsp15
VKVGSRLSIHTPAAEYIVEVRLLAEKRRPAAEARTFYEETAESIANREKAEQARRLERLANPQPSHGKLNKKDRRLIHRFTGKNS